MVKSKYTLDYKLIKDQIDRLLESVANKLEREWPQSITRSTPAAFMLLLGTVKVAGNTFKAIRFLCSEKSPRLATSPRNGTCCSAARKDDIGRALHMHLPVRRPSDPCRVVHVLRLERVGRVHRPRKARLWLGPCLDGVLRRGRS